MECKLCGTIVQEDGIFCSKCGARVDGKKNCPKCDKLIDENSVFCTYCGARVDGKVVCSVCGEIIEDRFCAKCGAEKEAKQNQQTIANSGEAATKLVGFKKINQFLTPGALLGALLVLFICSFFVGVSASALNIASEKTNAFYYFGEIYDNLKTSTQSIATEGGKIGVKISTILSTIFVAENLLVSFAMLTVGIIKVVFAIRKNETAKIGTFASISFASFLIAQIYLLTSSSGEMVVEGVNILITKMSSGGLCGIILGGILLFVGIVLNKFNLPKIKLVDLIKDVCFTATLIVLTILLVNFVSGNVLEQAHRTQDVVLKYSSSIWFGNASSYNSIALEGSYYEWRNTLSTLSMINFIVFVAILICLAVILINLLNSQLDKKSSNKFRITMFTVLTILSITSLILLISSVNVYENLESLTFMGDTLGNGFSLERTGLPIACVVLSAVAWAVSIVQKIFSPKKINE